jgi:hypothetical protein
MRRMAASTTDASKASPDTLQAQSFMKQAQSCIENAKMAHDAEVCALQTEVSHLRARLEELDNLEAYRDETSAPPATKDYNGGCFALCLAPPRNPGMVDTVTISGVSGQYAEVVKGVYTKESVAYNGSPFWRRTEKVDDSATGKMVDVWLLCFGNGHWAVTNTGRKDSNKPGGWMVSGGAPGHRHPAEVSQWQVNVGKSWEVQESVKVCTSSPPAPAPRSEGGAGGPGQRTTPEDWDEDAEDLDTKTAVDTINNEQTRPRARARLHQSHAASFIRPEISMHNRLESFMNHHWVEAFFATIIVFNTFLMAAGMQYTSIDIRDSLFQTGQRAADVWPGVDTAFEYIELCCGVIYFIEIVLKALAEHWRFFKDCWNILDASIVLLWLLQLGQVGVPVKSQFARMVRIARLGRLMHLVRTIEGFDALVIMTTSLRGSLSVVFWAFVLIFFCLMFIALLLYQVLTEFYFMDENRPLEERQEVFLYFGTFTRAMFSMFELTLANWPTLIRVLAENVHEGFFVYGILHKVSMGFAVVGVVNGVFMQQTFKVADMDDTIMVRKKQRQMKAHKRKMRRLFDAADEDKDGTLNLEEFQAILSSEELQMWMAAMEIDATDVPALFKLIASHDDDADISSDDLVTGISRLKGAARSLDVLTILQQLKELKETLTLLTNGNGANGHMHINGQEATV